MSEQQQYFYHAGISYAEEAETVCCTASPFVTAVTIAHPLHSTRYSSRRWGGTRDIRINVGDSCRERHKRGVGVPGVADVSQLFFVGSTAVCVFAHKYVLKNRPQVVGYLSYGIACATAVFGLSRVSSGRSHYHHYCCTAVRTAVALLAVQAPLSLVDSKYVKFR